MAIQNLCLIFDFMIIYDYKHVSNIMTMVHPFKFVSKTMKYLKFSLSEIEHLYTKYVIITVSESYS